MSTISPMHEQHDDTPALAYEAPVIESSDSVEALLGGKIS